MPRTAGPKRVHLSRVCPPDTLGQIPRYTDLCGHHRRYVYVCNLPLAASYQPKTHTIHPGDRKINWTLNHVYFETSVFSVDLERGPLTKQLLEITLGRLTSLRNRICLIENKLGHFTPCKSTPNCAKERTISAESIPFFPFPFFFTPLILLLLYFSTIMNARRGTRKP